MFTGIGPIIFTVDTQLIDFSDVTGQITVTIDFLCPTLSAEIDNTNHLSPSNPTFTHDLASVGASDVTMTTTTIVPSGCNFTFANAKVKNNSDPQAETDAAHITYDANTGKIQIQVDNSSEPSSLHGVTTPYRTIVDVVSADGLTPLLSQ